MGLKRNKKRQKKFQQKEEDDNKNGPRILVINRGSVGPVIPQLMNDVQSMLSPHVVKSIKVLRSTKVQHLIAAAGPLQISHAVVFTRTDNGAYMKLCTLPQGPTITFSLQNFSLHSDVLASQKRPITIPTSYNQTAPCLMMNALQPHSGPKHLQLVASSMLQLFPKIVPHEATAQRIRRCCMLNYDEATQEFDMRHYLIHMSSSTSKKLISKLVNGIRIPNLQAFETMEDAIDDAGVLSESEGEEEDNKVVVGQQLEGYLKKPIAPKSSVKMKDCGPRITMKLQKIESGLLGGDVLYNRTQKKSAKEIMQIKFLREQKKEEKVSRIERQEKDVTRKKDEAEIHKERCLKGQSQEEQDKANKNMRKRKREEDGEEDTEDEDGGEGDNEDDSDTEDDAEYYKEEVGDLPEGVEFSSRMKRRREKDPENLESKKENVQSAEEKKTELRKEKAKEKYRELDKRRKTKKPRSYGKRLVRKMKRDFKSKVAVKEAEKKKVEHQQAFKPVQQKKKA